MINLKKLFKTILHHIESETPSYLKYHNAAHTRQVIRSAEIIAAAENVSNSDLDLLRVALNPLH